MIGQGDVAPDFEGETSQGTKFKLSGLKGHPVVLYFYPKAMTGGCTTESKGFRDHFDELGARDVRVVGVSVDTVEDEKKFSEMYGFQFPLVADPTGKIAEAYGVLRSTGGAKRVTFLIGADGHVVRVIDSNIPGNHVGAACSKDW
jgi:thioredoxin-dependent peroxiredoxin